MLLKLFGPVALLLCIIPLSFPIPHKDEKTVLSGFLCENSSSSNKFIPAHPVISEVKFLTEQSGSLCF